MELVYTLVFTVFPYLCLTTFVVGHGYRYVTDRYHWNARSSEFLEKKSLFYGSVLFHWGIVLTFLGHAGGLLIPQKYFDLAGFDSHTHLTIAYGAGLAAGLAAFAGALLLLRRRLTHPRVQAAGHPERYDHHRWSRFRHRGRVLQRPFRPLQRSLHRCAVDKRDSDIHARCGAHARGSPQLQDPCSRRSGIARVFAFQPVGAHLERTGVLLFPAAGSCFDGTRQAPSGL